MASRLCARFPKNILRIEGFSSSPIASAFILSVFFRVCNFPAPSSFQLLSRPLARSLVLVGGRVVRVALSCLLAGGQVCEGESVGGVGEGV